MIAYNKDEHNWGDKLRESIKKSILEVSKNPKLSILTTFMETTDEPSIAATELEKVVIDLKQDVDTLQHEVRQLKSIKNLESGGIMSLSRGGLMNHPFISNVQPFYPERRYEVAELFKSNISSDDLAEEAISAIMGESNAKKKPDDK